MNIILHNRLEIFNGTDKKVYFNTMLDSVLNEIKLKHSYNDYLAIGTGSDESVLSTYKLGSHLKTYELDAEYLQDDASISTMYIKKKVVIEDSFLDNKLITEAGITNTLDENPTIFNYFELKNENNILGITKKKGIPLVISIYIFLSLSKSPTYEGLLTSGKNKFVDFLLGNGIDGDIYCTRGKLLTGNSSMINREKVNREKFPCTMNIELENRELVITFVGNLGGGQASEVLMLVDDEPFARIMTVSTNSTALENNDFYVKSNKVVEIGDNVSEIVSVTNNTTHTSEQNYIKTSFANNFGDEVYLPFHNLFDNDTARFISKDGKMIFFVVDDKVYGYKNENYNIIELDTSSVSIQNIVNIFSIDKFMFVISKNQPYIFAYKLTNNIFVECQVDFSSFDKFDVISNIFKCDLTYSSENKLMFSVIDKSQYYGWTIYFDYDENSGFTYDNYVCSEYKFNYVLSMVNSTFNDAMSIFLKGDEMPHLCKIVYHYKDKTVRDIYSTISYYLTYDTKEIYTCGKAIVVEHLSSSTLSLYLYPEIENIEFDDFENVVDYYISSNLKYMINKFDDGTFKTYNLIGYSEPSEFEIELENLISSNKIVDFAFLNDTLLVFLNDDNKKIIALSLYENKTCIENVSSNLDTYNITFRRFNVVGDNGEQVIANFMMRLMV